MQLLGDIQALRRQPTISTSGIVNTASGTGSCAGHNGEIIQLTFDTRNGRLYRALVTMPHPNMVGTAQFSSNPHCSRVRVWPEGCRKALAAACETLEWLQVDCGGDLYLRSNIPSSRGNGSSSVDVIAAIRAVASAFRIEIPASIQSRIAVRAEGACDSIMYGPDETVLFAHREGIVLEHFAGPLPPMTVLAFDTEPDGAGVDTLRMPRARYSSREIQTQQMLIDAVRTAIRNKDIQLLGQAATASAQMNQRFLPTARFDDLSGIRNRCNASGLQVSHSGTVAGLFWPPNDPQLDARIALATTALGDVGYGCFSTYSIGTPQKETHHAPFQ